MRYHKDARSVLNRAQWSYVWGPPGGWGGPHSIGPRLFWTWRRAGVCFRWVVPDTHDYFMPRPGRLSSKSGADMIISCDDQRLVGSARQCPTLAVWALRLGGVVFQRLHQNSYPGRLVFSLLRRWGGVPKVGVVFQKVVPESPLLDGVVFQKLGWCSKKLSQNPHVSMGW